MAERLQKVLARAGYGSRRSCEDLIRASRVFVDGRPAYLGMKVDVELARIEVDGKLIQLQKNMYIKLNKPRGVLSSTVDELDLNRPTLLDIVKLEEHIYPVGRLDKNSQGLIILTNDGSLTHLLTHPRFGHKKRYQVAVEGKISENSIDLWRSGIMLDGRKTSPVEISITGRKKDRTWLRIVMREGRKRQIRRIAAQLGHPVTTLIRDQIGPIELEDLAEGEWRHLSKREVQKLKAYVEHDMKKA